LAAIDSILGIVAQQNASELRLGVDREPEMFRDTTRMRLALEPTSDETLRILLGPLLDQPRETALKRAPVEFSHEVPGVGAFQVVMTSRKEGDGFDVVFIRAGSAVTRREPEPVLPQVPEEPRRATPESSGVMHEPPRPRAACPSEPLVSLLSRAAALRASDVHLREGQPPAVRIDGRLQSMLGGPIASLEAFVGASLAANLHSALRDRRSEDVAFEVAGVGRFRLNVYGASAVPCASIRILPETPPALATLRIPVPTDDLVDLPHGLVIVTGPTGSGKSTTLASLAQEALRRRSVLLITLEDPIEYRLHPGRGSLVRQREIGGDVIDFPTGLRDALREDPDVILIGEMRDAESIGLTLTAAETGHLVLASLHSRSAASAIERVVDTYPPERQSQVRVQLADALRAVVSQRLLPLASGEGRTPAVELLRVNHNVANQIREGRTAQLTTVMQSGMKDGQLPLEKCLADMVRCGQVRAEDARAVANDPVALASYMRG
jgi:twitching motility protein PilT